MATQDHTTLTHDQIVEITALSRTLLETSRELSKLCQRHHPNLDQAKWMIELAIETAQVVFSKITRET